MERMGSQATALAANMHSGACRILAPGCHVVVEANLPAIRCHCQEVSFASLCPLATLALSSSPLSGRLASSLLLES